MLPPALKGLVFVNNPNAIMKQVTEMKSLSRECIHTLWDELARYPATQADEACRHLLRTVRDRRGHRQRWELCRRAVGVNYGTVTASYWDTQTSGQTTSAGGTGLTTAQLKSSLPAGFSSSVWGSNRRINHGYPYLLALPPQ